MNSTFKLGTKLLKAVEKNAPLNINGKAVLAPKQTFQLNNPYILESLPDKLTYGDSFEKLSNLNGKDLNKVEKFLNNMSKDDSTLNTALTKLNNIFHKNAGFSNDEISILLKKAFPNVKIPTDSNLDAMIHLNQLSKNAGSQFDAHGMAKISVTQQLKNLNTFLATGLKKNICSAPLVAKNNAVGAGLGTGGGHAYRDGSFILVGEKGKPLQQGIKHVIVNDTYYSIIDDLQKKFTDINFVRADKSVQYFEQIAK